MSRMLTIIEQYQILYHEWQGEVKAIMIWCMLGLFLGLGLFFLCHSAWMAYKRQRRDGVSALTAVAFIAYAMLVAWAAHYSNKPARVPSATIVFDAGLYDQGSVATNDHPVIAWRFDPWLYADTVHISARPKGSTNELDWIDYHSGPVSDTIWRGFIPACTGMVIWVWSEYIPPAPESTNGVYHLDYLTEPLDYNPVDETVRQWQLLRTPIIDAADGRYMSPPIIPEPLIIDFINQSQNNQEPEE